LHGAAGVASPPADGNVDASLSGKKKVTLNARIYFGKNLNYRTEELRQ
jgi:hypothetical protein